MLGLKVYGKMDIPKGHVDPGESDLEAAFRESYEEASLSKPSLNMRWGEIAYLSERPHKDVIIYIAETDSEPEIRPNPTTGQYEHHGYSWLTKADMLRMSHNYLKPVVEWAFGFVENERVTERRG